LIDEKDMRILSILEEDARMPWRRIARMMNLSEATIYIRVNRLVSRGVIEGYSVILSPEKLGLTATAFILIRCEASRCRAIADKLRELPFVTELHLVTGGYQLLVRIQAPTHDRVTEAVEEITKLKGVIETSTILSLNKYKSGSSLVDALRYWRARGP